MELNTERLYSQETADYLSGADRRIVSGFRFALELLELQIPNVASPRPSGPRRRTDVLRDYHADNPVEAIRDRHRNLEAGFAASVSNRKARMNNA